MELSQILPGGTTVGVKDPTDLTNGRGRKLALDDPLYQDALSWMIHHGAPQDYSYYTLPDTMGPSDALNPNSGTRTFPGPTALVWHGLHAATGEDIFAVTDPEAVYVDQEEGLGTSSWAPFYALAAVLSALGQDIPPVQMYAGLEITGQQKADPVGEMWIGHGNLHYHTSAAFAAHPERWPLGTIYPRLLPSGQIQRFERVNVIDFGGSAFSTPVVPAWRNLSGVIG